MLLESRIYLLDFFRYIVPKLVKSIVLLLTNDFHEFNVSLWFLNKALKEYSSK